MVNELKSFVQDTRHVLAKVADLRITEKAWLVSIDVESLYTSIPHNWGMAAVKGFLEKRLPNFGPQNAFLVELLEFALNNNFSVLQEILPTD